MNSKSLSAVACCFPILFMSGLAAHRWRSTAIEAPPSPVVQPAASGKSDCPMFGGTPQRNMVNTIDKNTPTAWNIEKGKLQNVKWTATLGGNRSFGGPVIADGRVYVATNEKGKSAYEKAVLVAFNEADGKFLWKISHDISNDLVDEARLQGLCSTPAVEGKFIYYVTPDAQVICADTAGKVKWSYDMMKDLQVVPFHLSNCSPLVVGDLVMIITGNGVNDEDKVVNPKAPAFAAFNKTTGKLVWQSSLPGDKIIQGQWSNPTLATVNGKQQVIFAGGDSVIYSLEPLTGEVIWKCNCNPVPKKKEDREVQPYIIATPVIVGDRLYVGMGIYPENPQTLRSSFFLCLDITKKGDVSPKNLDAKDTANKNSALVWAFGGPINPPPARGRQVYFGKTISTAAVQDGLVYISEETGYLHCLDAKTGQRYWDHDFKASIWGSAYWVDGKVYVGTEDGEVVVFAHGKTEKKVAAVSMDEPVLSTPVVANGVLFVLTKSKLYAIANGK